MNNDFQKTTLHLFLTGPDFLKKSDRDESGT